MTSLTEKLSRIAGEAFIALDLPSDLGQVRISDRPDLAQFQCNGAMAAAKIAKKNPRAVAEEVSENLKQNPIFAAVDIAGPGFINLNVTEDYLADHLAEMAGDERSGVEKTGKGTVIVDYGGPNIAKPMHVGHLRASIIGESVRRTIKFAGYHTLGDIHMGDWGTHMGMLFADYVRTGETDRVLNTDLSDKKQAAALFEDLSERYPRASQACKADETLMAEAHKATKALQNKKEPYISLWQTTKDVSVIGMKKNFESLNVHFDLWKGEADVHDLIPPMVEDLKQKGLAIESDGALIIHVAQEDDKKEIPPLILYKRDGAVMYGTTDLGTIVDRMQYNPIKIIHIVDQRQHLHFEQFFRAARMGQLLPDSTELIHAGFGTMNGPDGKPFKTRVGGVMKLEDLIAMGLEKAQARLDEAALAQDMDEEERANVAHKIAIAAIKFADLQNQRQSDYVFDLDRLTSFEGKTGPYLLYQAVRIKSLLRKAEYVDGTTSFVLKEGDLPLALLLTELPNAFEGALNNYAPHHLCDYAYRLAQTFSSFYGRCHILSEEDEALKQSRLALCAFTAKQLELVLGLLGIEVPDRM